MLLVVSGGYLLGSETDYLQLTSILVLFNAGRVNSGTAAA